MFKKIIIVALIFVSLVSCNDASSVVDENDNGETIKNEEIINKKKLTEEKSTKEKETKNSEWFVGEIDGRFKIHIRFNIIDDKIIGEYYYDRESNEISIRIFGYVNDRIYSIEGEDNSEILFVMSSQDSIQGIWRDETNIFSIYAIRENVEEVIPKLTSSDVVKLEGKYVGTDSDMFAESSLEIMPVFNHLIYFKLEARNGTHIGDCSFFAVAEDNEFITYSDEVEFRVSKNENEEINLYSSDYTYSCGASVSYSKTYSENVEVKKFDGLDLKLADNEKDLIVIEQIMGEYYDVLLYYGQYHDEEMINGFKTRTFLLIGFPDTFMIMRKFDEIYIGISDYIVEDGGNLVFTNSDNPVPKEMELFLINDYEIRRTSTSKNGFATISEGIKVRDFIPEGWEIKDRVVGNLNNDKYDDVVLVIDKIENSDLKTPRVLIILEGKDSGYKVDLVSNRALLGPGDGGVWGDPYDYLEMIDNKLIISFYGGSNYRWSYTYTFDYDNKYRLINVLSASYQTTSAEVEEIKFNLITNEVVVANYDADNNETKEIYKKVKSEFIYLKTFNIYKDLDYEYR